MATTRFTRWLRRLGRMCAPSRRDEAALWAGRCCVELGREEDVGDPLATPTEKGQRPAGGLADVGVEGRLLDGLFDLTTLPSRPVAPDGGYDER